MVPQLSVKWSGVKAPVGPGGRITKRTRTLSKDSRRGTAVALDQKVFCIQLSPSNKTVAVSYADGEIRLFDFIRRRSRRTPDPAPRSGSQHQELAVANIHTGQEQEQEPAEPPDPDGAPGAAGRPRGRMGGGNPRSSNVVFLCMFFMALEADSGTPDCQTSIQDEQLRRGGPRVASRD